MARGQNKNKWDATCHEDILLSLFQHVTLSANDFAKIMEDMNKRGYTFTESALRYGIFTFPFSLSIFNLKLPSGRVGPFDAGA